MLTNASNGVEAIERNGAAVKDKIFELADKNNKLMYTSLRVT